MPFSCDMSTLVAVLSIGKGSWGHVARLIDGWAWDNVVLVVNRFAKERFSSEKVSAMIEVDDRKPLPVLVSELEGSLRGAIKEPEVALNIVSGSGREHMAVLAALLKLGLGIRLIVYTDEGVKEV